MSLRPNQGRKAAGDQHVRCPVDFMPKPLCSTVSVAAGLCESSRPAGLVLLACRLKGDMGPRLRGDDDGGGLLALDWLVGMSAWQRGFERADVRKWAARIAAGGCGA